MAVEGKNFLVQMEGILIVMLFMVAIHPEIIKEQTFENRQIQSKKRNAIFRQRRERRYPSLFRLFTTHSHDVNTIHIVISNRPMQRKTLILN